MRKRIVTEGLGVSRVFALPWLVARDEGFFEQEGIEVEFAANQQRQKLPHVSLDPGSVDSIRTHTPFEDGVVNIYRACEWGQIRRAWDSGRGGKIVSKRSCIAVMAILSAPGSRYTYPQTLRNAPVSVSFHNGNHYATLQMLEGFLDRSEIRVVGQHYRDGYHSVLKGEVAAVALTEPWLTVAEKHGFQKIIETHYHGSEIAGPEIDSETFAAIQRAERRAVQLFNMDKKRYLHFVLEALPDDVRETVSEEDFYLPRLRYSDPEPYLREEFEHAYAWMESWGLIGSGASYEDIVDNRIIQAVP